MREPENRKVQDEGQPGEAPQGDRKALSLQALLPSILEDQSKRDLGLSHPTQQKKKEEEVTQDRKRLGHQRSSTRGIAEHGCGRSRVGIRLSIAGRTIERLFAR